MIKSIIDRLEDQFIKWLVVVAALFSICITYFYSKGWIINVRSSMSDIMVVASTMFVVLSFIMTLLISLKESELFKRISVHFPFIDEKINIFLFKIILASVATVILATLIKVIPYEVDKVVKIAIALVSGWCFSYMSFGTIYMLKFTTDLILKDARYKKDQVGKMS